MSGPTKPKSSDAARLTRVMADLHHHSNSLEDDPWRSRKSEKPRVEVRRQTSDIPGSMERAAGANNHSTTSKSTVWRPSDVGYFLPNNTSYEHHYCEQGVLYFSNVFAFIQHIRGIAVQKSEEVIRNNIQTCLRGKALDWYAVELSNPERAKLACLPLETGWYEQLIQRFRPLSSVSRDQYQYAEYTVDDAWAGQDPTEWAHTVMRDAAASGVTDTYQQLRQIWYAIDMELMWPVECPKKDTSVSVFLKQLDDAYQEWCYKGQQS